MHRVHFTRGTVVGQLREWGSLPSCGGWITGILRDFQSRAGFQPAPHGQTGPSRGTELDDSALAFSRFVAGDQTRAAIKAQVLKAPADKHQHAVAELRQIHQMDEEP